MRQVLESARTSTAQIIQTYCPKLHFSLALRREGLRSTNVDTARWGVFEPGEIVDIKHQYDCLVLFAQALDQKQKTKFIVAHINGGDLYQQSKQALDGLIDYVKKHELTLSTPKFICNPLIHIFEQMGQNHILASRLTAERLQEVKTPKYEHMTAPSADYAFKCDQQSPVLCKDRNGPMVKLLAAFLGKPDISKDKEHIQR